MVNTGTELINTAVSRKKNSRMQLLTTGRPAKRGRLMIISIALKIITVSYYRLYPACSPWSCYMGSKPLNSVLLETVMGTILRSFLKKQKNEML